MRLYMCSTLVYGLLNNEQGVTSAYPNSPTADADADADVACAANEDVDVDADVEALSIRM